MHPEEVNVVLPLGHRHWACDIAPERISWTQNTFVPLTADAEVREASAFLNSFKPA
jgi:hypothetical protein